MPERNISRPWTEQEDNLLRIAVAELGTKEDWKAVASRVKGRDNKACRKRWKHSLVPTVRKVPWTSNEDALLKVLYETHGSKWSVIARNIPGRTDDACSKRYQQALDPKLIKGEWTDEEVGQLIEAHHRLGSKWVKVGAELNRSGLDCRNKWRGMTTSPKKKRQKTGDELAPTLEQYGYDEPGGSLDSPYQDEYLTVHPYTDEAPPTQVFHEEYRGYTPEPPRIKDPNIAPFQPSSSSLCSALSEVIMTHPHPPMPPPTLSNTPELIQHDDLHQLSPLSNTIDMDYIFSQPQIAMDHRDTFQIFNHEDFLYGYPNPFDIIPVPSPIWKTTRMPTYEDSPQSFQSPSILNEETLSATSTPFSPNAEFSPLEHFSSFNLNTPYVFSAQLPPSSSPNAETIVDLPNTENPTVKSLLFSLPGSFTPGVITDSGSINNDSVMDAARRARKRKVKQPIIKAFSTSRLSSLLPLGNDPNLRPYACGRPQCWPAGEPTSSSCFTTSGELLEHCKEVHPGDDLPSDKPFRCALPGCGRTWKSINGLQYHLQISTVHFTNEMYNRFSAQQVPNTPEQTMSPLSVEAEVEGDEPERKFTCPRPGCFKAYRQPSGLRYHVKFGHPADMPAQLSIVPPALEKQMSQKAKKLRAKPVMEMAMAVGS